MSCIFCKIINGEIPSYKIYEDEHVFAFLDISQHTKGHTLVIPKKCVRNIYELDEETAANLFRVVPKIAKALKETFDPIGLNIVNNNEKPLQAVFHYHIHLIPRYPNDNFVIKGDNNTGNISSDVFSTMQKNIQKNLI